MEKYFGTEGFYVWGQTPLKFYKVGKQKEKICIC